MSDRLVSPDWPDGVGLTECLMRKTLSQRRPDTNAILPGLVGVPGRSALQAAAQAQSVNSSARSQPVEIG